MVKSCRETGGARRVVDPMLVRDLVSVLWTSVAPPGLTTMHLRNRTQGCAGDSPADPGLK